MKFVEKMVNVYLSSQTLDRINEIKTLRHSIKGTLGGLFTKVSLFPKVFLISLHIG